MNGKNCRDIDGPWYCQKSLSIARQAFFKMLDLAIHIEIVIFETDR